VDRFSVEFLTRDIIPARIFRIRALTSSGMGILVKDNSAILGHLNVGKIMDLKYQPIHGPKIGEYLRTEIKQVTRDDEGRFRGHHVIGLSIVE